MKCDAQQVIETYPHHADIEDCFKVGKGDCNMDSIRSQPQTTMTGRFIVSFLRLPC